PTRARALTPAMKNRVQPREVRCQFWIVLSEIFQLQVRTQLLGLVIDAKGLTLFVIRNALGNRRKQTQFLARTEFCRFNPLLTIFGYSLAALLSGAFIVENIMAWPGLGRLTIEAFFAKDSYLVVDSVVMATALLVVGNFIADILLAWSDPRIRLK
ncbi:MAG: ABC transporter permease subunit, partial [Verrucomicrobiota bacterium]